MQRNTKMWHVLGGSFLKYLVPVSKTAANFTSSTSKSVPLQCLQTAKSLISYGKKTL